MVALVQRPAPGFKATAVVEGQFKEISLSDFLGQWYVFFGQVDTLQLTRPSVGLSSSSTPCKLINGVYHIVLRISRDFTFVCPT